MSGRLRRRCVRTAVITNGLDNNWPHGSRKSPVEKCLEPRRRQLVYSLVTASLLLLLLLGAGPASTEAPLLVVLTDTGRQQDGRPVVERIDASEHLAVLTASYSGRLLRLYRLVQHFAHPDRPPQPAYLVLSDNQGGFPRAGFVLDGVVQPETTFVDLHRRSDLTGRPGAMDQIFPHELMHIIVAELAGEAPEGKASQVHAIGVRTDRVTAFNEGFAEHAQVMAIDDPAARPETRAIGTDLVARDRVMRQFDDYGRGRPRALGGRAKGAHDVPAVVQPWRAGVALSRREGEPLRPRAGRARAAAHAGWCVSGISARERDARPRGCAAEISRTASGERRVRQRAVLSRLVNTPAIRDGVRDDAFYARFGVRRAALDPLDNAYLKVFAAIRDGRYDTAAVIDAYARLFPEEADAARGVLRETMLGQDVPRAPEIWLLNAHFAAGTTLFDQYRALPRVQTFDLNAASAAELAAVPNVDRELARAILRAAPFASLDDLTHVPRMTPAAVASFQEMRRAMEAPPAPGTSAEGSLSFRSIGLPYLWRGLKVWLVCALLAAALYRAVRRVSWWRLPLIGLAATLAGLIAGWTIDSGSGLLALAAPVAVFGVPGALIALWRYRTAIKAATVLAAWVCASVAAALAVAVV